MSDAAEARADAERWASQVAELQVRVAAAEGAAAAASTPSASSASSPPVASAAAPAASPPAAAPAAAAARKSDQQPSLTRQHSHTHDWQQTHRQRAHSRAEQVETRVESA